MTTLFMLVQLFYPLCYLLGWMLKIEFFLYSEAVYCVVTALVSLILRKKFRESAWNLILFPVTAAVCMIEILLFRSVLAVPSAVIRCFCAWVASDYVPDGWKKTVVRGIGGLIVMGLIAVCGFDLTFGSMGRITVVQEVKSPDGTLTAQLIDGDYGATGGDTLVKVYAKQYITVGIGGFRPPTRTIYQGRWGEYQDMTLSWQDDSTLLINEMPYNLNQSRSGTS